MLVSVRRGPCFVAPHLPRKICAEHREDSQGSYLRRQSRNHDVDARLTAPTIFYRIGQAPASSLERKGDDIPDNEDDGISTGLEACEMGPVEED